MRPEPTIIDTDIRSEIVKAKNPIVRARAEAYAQERGTLSITSVTVLEMLYGFHRRGASGQIRLAEQPFDSNEEIVPDGDDYRLAARIMGRLDVRGTRIGLADPLIASCALSRDLAFATGNTRHFGFIQDAGFSLRLEDWRAP